MKTLSHLLLLAVGFGIIVFGFKLIPFRNIGLELANRTIYVERNNTPFLQDWTIDFVLTKINSAREQEGFSKIKLNEKLNQAALGRLSVPIFLRPMIRFLIG
ncbi:MAG: hypothetical protein UW31_C0005G0129 [Candidatus Collierbacteria bacterium GW2011_GWA2_44_13]|nr:MAG: hypothetical protein UW31_C0005G0129 [Candidatus Collierbacteria bacterium GW2011_GWA2_44_13]